MISSKVFTSSILLSNSLIFMRQNNQFKAECEERTAAEKAATDLDQIFAAQDGGMPPDPEEIQEMLMKA